MENSIFTLAVLFFLGFIILHYTSTHKKLIFKFMQGFNKCPDDDLNLPFVMMSTPNRGEITESGKSKISIYLAHSLKFFNTVNIFHE